MGQYKAMTAPYEVYLAPPGTAIFDPSEITSKPQAPWVLVEEGTNEKIARQNPVMVKWEREMEEEEPSMNESFSDEVHVVKRGIEVTWSMKNVGLRTIAKLLDDATVTAVARTAQRHQSVEFEFDEADPKYWALLLLAYNQREPNSVKLPSIGWLAKAYVAGNIERSSSRVAPTMIDVTMRGLKDRASGKVGRFKDILQGKGI